MQTMNTSVGKSGDTLFFLASEPMETMYKKSTINSLLPAFPDCTHRSRGSLTKTSPRTGELSTGHTKVQEYELRLTRLLT